MNFSNSLASPTNPWGKLISMAQDRTPIQIKVCRVNQGGCLCYYEGLRGFIPNSHLLDRSESPSKLIGETLKVIAYEVDPDSGKLVLSQKEARKDEYFASLKVGDLLNGKIVKVQYYGFLVDLGHGVTGLLHKSSIPSNSADLYGLEVTVDVLIASKEGGRIALALDNQSTAEPEQALSDGCLSFEGQLFLSERFFSSSVMLSDSEFALLRCLLQRRREIVPYDLMLQEWGIPDGSIDAIRSTVHLLRRHDPLKDRIKNVYGVGYRLEVPEG